MMVTNQVVRPERATQILRDLIAIESVNPYFPGGDRGEVEVGRYLADFFTQLGLSTARQEVLPGRWNVFTRLGSAAAGRRVLLFETHMDTVTLEPVGRAMLEPTERDGYLHGRGACDDKASLAAMLAALEALVSRASELKVDVVVLGSVDEEYLMRGIDMFASTGPRVDAAVVGEPTNLQVVRAHKGLVRWRLRTEGRSAHTANPEKGDNAIYQMLTVAQALRHEIEPLLASRSHPLLTPPTLTIARIEGGTAVNIVPDFCSIDIDRRTLPSEDPRDVIAELEAILEGVRRRDPGVRVTLGDPFANIGGIDTPEETEIVRISRRVSQAVAGVESVIGVPFGTNAAALAGAGIPVIVLGPGDIAQAHTADEYVEIRQVDLAAEIYARIALEFPA
jgi:acetylornithine deacetylase ArgE